MLVDQVVRSSSRRVRSWDWKTLRRRGRVDAGDDFLSSRQTSIGLEAWSSGMVRAWMAAEMVCHWVVSGKTKEKSRSTAW